MTSYIIRRLLLMIPTFLGCTLVVFLIIQQTPGGPIEQLQLMYQAGGAGAETTGGGGSEISTDIPEESLAELKAYFNLDKPLIVRYFIWLGNLVTGDFGISYVYAEPVLDVITSRFPISIYFGIIGFILSYSVCIPLGIMKALKNNSTFDIASSSIVFVGYSIPGWALGVFLMAIFGKELGWFPLGDFRSDGWEYLSTGEKITDQIHHTILPVISYMAGSFAVLTVLMKNSLLENLGQDYIRTAFAKGLSEKRAIFVHAVRNSLIPIITGLSSILAIFVAGSFLIERVFNINGIGLLGYNSVVNRDYTVMMGLLVINVFILLFGNLFRDVLYAIVDPRIRLR